MGDTRMMIFKRLPQKNHFLSAEHFILSDLPYNLLRRISPNTPRADRHMDSQVREWESTLVPTWPVACGIPNHRDANKQTMLWNAWYVQRP